MRTLKFIVDGQILRPDPNSDFDGLVPGTEGHVRAIFSFSPEWAGCAKVAAFYSRLGREYKPQKLMYGTTCIIPADALKKRIFKVQVLGRSANSAIITTNKLEIRQTGGKL